MQKKLSHALHWIIGILEKHHIGYQIVGWFAAHMFWAHRPINDIDIDITEADFDTLYDEVKEYIVFGPGNYQDKKWNLTLMTLNYFGQEIDIWGAYETKIFDEISQKWIASPADFTLSRKILFDGFWLSVIDPLALITYKSLLDGDHQKTDICAVYEYIKKNSPQHFSIFRHRLALQFMNFFPQIQLVALCNSRAMGEADENSDIDLFIIAKKGNLWTARFLTTAITTLLFVRRKNTQGLQKWTPDYIRRTKNKFCLSFFITEEAMNLDSVRLQPNDPYLDRWIYTLVPLVNKNQCYEWFIKENSNRAPLSRGESKGGLVVPENKDFSPWLNPPVFDHPPWQGGLASVTFFEWLIKKLWLPRTLKTYERLGKPWWVVISDTMLKFHDNDQRIIYRDMVNSKQ